MAEGLRQDCRMRETAPLAAVGNDEKEIYVVGTFSRIAVPKGRKSCSIILM